MTWLLHGVEGITLSADSQVGPPGDGTWSPESDVYEGAGIGVEIAPAGDVFVESGRVTLRDPIDVLALGRRGDEEWTTSAGLEVHF